MILFVADAAGTERGNTYAARFCAFLLLIAGVIAASFSSLLLLVLVMASMSPPSPLSTLPAGLGVWGIGEPCAMCRPGAKG